MNVQIWQHCDCVGVKSLEGDYFCEICQPRPVPTVSSTTLLT